MANHNFNPNIIDIPSFSPDSIANLGSKALGAFLESPLQEELTPELLIAAGSLGATERQVADKFPGIGRKDVIAMKTDIIKASGLPNIAAVVNLQIQTGKLRVAVMDEKPPELSNFQMHILRQLSAGKNIREIARELEISRSKFNTLIKPRVFARIDANGPTHSVRRGYEVGLFLVP